MGGSGANASAAVVSGAAAVNGAAELSMVRKLLSGLARGRRTPEGPGSRPVLAQNQGVRVAIPAGAFYAPTKQVPGFVHTFSS